MACHDDSESRERLKKEHFRIPRIPTVSLPGPVQKILDHDLWVKRGALG